MTKLSALVDDYLAKHDLAVRAGNAWDIAKRNGHGFVAQKAMDAFIKAANARAAAFRALRAARAGKIKR